MNAEKDLDEIAYEIAQLNCHKWSNFDSIEIDCEYAGKQNIDTGLKG